MDTYDLRRKKDYSGVVPSVLTSAGLSALVTGLASGGDVGSIGTAATVGGIGGGTMSALASAMDNGRARIIRDESTGRFYAPTRMVPAEAIDRMRASGAFRNIGGDLHMNDEGSLIYDSGKKVTYAHQPQITDEVFNKWLGDGYVTKRS